MIVARYFSVIASLMALRQAGELRRTHGFRHERRDRVCAVIGRIIRARPVVTGNPHPAERRSAACPGRRAVPIDHAGPDTAPERLPVRLGAADKAGREPESGPVRLGQSFVEVFGPDHLKQRPEDLFVRPIGNGRNVDDAWVQKRKAGFNRNQFDQ